MGAQRLAFLLCGGLIGVIISVLVHGHYYCQSHLITVLGASLVLYHFVGGTKGRIITMWGTE